MFSSCLVPRCVQVLLFPALFGHGDGNLLWWKVGFLCNAWLPGTAVWGGNAHSSIRFGKTIVIANVDKTKTLLAFDWDRTDSC